MNKNYVPVPQDFRNTIEDIKTKEIFSEIFYFDEHEVLHTSKGVIEGIASLQEEGDYLITNNKEKIRLDRIVKIEGVPGPALKSYHSQLP
ncbi:hypothetical protein RCC89_18735 [Cytophagaceae bacterium ABcell3]|nr:hypothetical protein RCC89_18735 [Cytophagaceae bacterium ABcell3]